MNKVALLSILVLALAVMGCQSIEMMPEPEGPEHPGQEFTKHYKFSHFALTQDGLYSVELVFKEGTLKTGLNNLDIIIHDKDATGTPDQSSCSLFGFRRCRLRGCRKAE